MSDVPSANDRPARTVITRREAVLALVTHIWSQPDPPPPEPALTRWWRRLTRR